MPRNNESKVHDDEPVVIKRPRSPRNISPERRENCATALNASRVFDTVAKIRGLNDTQLADLISSARPTINQKRSGEKPLTLFDIESLAYVLRIPAYLFLRPWSDTLIFLASQENSEDENGAPDQGIRHSGCNYGTPGCDPEIVIDLRDDVAVAG